MKGDRVRVSNAVTTRKILTDDLVQVGFFLHANLNWRLSAEGWAASIVPPWQGTERDTESGYGYLLEDDATIVGVQLVFSSRRDLGSGPITVRNLGALCVLPAYRSQSVRLLRAALGGKNNHLTDLSPSGAVVPLNERLGFTRLDTATALVPALPGRTSSQGSGGRTRVITDPDRIALHLAGRDLEIYRDHEEARASHHVVLKRGQQSCYVVWRRDRRKRLPIFASVLYANDRGLLHSVFPVLSRHLLLRHGVLAVLAELRIVGPRPRWSIMLSSPRPKMFRSPTLPASAIDYLYSELNCIAW